MLKVLATEVPPPGVGLVDGHIAPSRLDRSLAGTAAVTLVLLTNVVVSAAPAQFTTVPETKFEPVTVRVNAASPTVPLAGEIEVTLGSGLPFPLPPGGGVLEPPASATCAQETDYSNDEKFLNSFLHDAPRH